jgi:hypothetical protein
MGANPLADNESPRRGFDPALGAVADDRARCGVDHLLGDVSGMVGDRPGTITMHVTRELPDGTVCTGTHTIRVVRFPPVRLRYATFIECPVLSNPFGLVSLSDFFGGDDRGFDRLSPQYRSVHERLIAPHLFTISGPEAFPYDLSPFSVSGTIAPYGESTGYDAAVVSSNPTPSPCPDILLPGATPVVRQTLQATAPSTFTFDGTIHSFEDAIVPGNWYMAVRRLAPKTVKVYIWVNGSNPLVPTGPGITGFVTAMLSFSVHPSTGERTVTVTCWGEHDGFPAHEIYANDTIL